MLTSIYLVYRGPDPKPILVENPIGFTGRWLRPKDPNAGALPGSSNMTLMVGSEPKDLIQWESSHWPSVGERSGPKRVLSQFKIYSDLWYLVCNSLLPLNDKIDDDWKNTFVQMLSALDVLSVGSTHSSWFCLHSPHPWGSASVHFLSSSVCFVCLLAHMVPSTSQELGKIQIWAGH